MKKNKPKIAIFDLTDCEGCESEFINLLEKLAIFAEEADIINWRLATDNQNLSEFDVCFIEGSPITESDIESVKRLRGNSRTVVSLGSCAELGGIQTSITEKEWKEGIPLVYGKSYKTSSKFPRPLSYYVDVDIHLPGCPINKNELAEVLASLLIGKKPVEARYPVCLECKARENTCLLLDGEPCLGPVTKGGCEAVCPSRGLRCWGCFGALRGGNQKALKNFFEKSFGKERTKQILKSFYSSQDEYKALYPREETQSATKKLIKKIKV